MEESSIFSEQYGERAVSEEVSENWLMQQGVGLKRSE